MKVWIAESLDNGIEHVFDSREKAIDWTVLQLRHAIKDYLERYENDDRGQLRWIVDALQTVTFDEPFIEDVSHVYAMEIE